QAAAYGLVLAQQHVEDYAIDLVVYAVVGQSPDFIARLSVSIHTAFALFVARRIPRQVVMDHRVEVLLQVNAFAQAVSADQYGLFTFGGCGGELSDSLFALLRRQKSRDGGDFDPRFEFCAQRFCYVLSGRYEAAEDDRLKTVFEQVGDKSDSLL